MTIRTARAALERGLPALVVAAAVLGWAVSGPPRLLDRHQAINILLAVLVFASAMTIPAGAAGRVRTVAPRLAIVVIAAAAALPLLAFAASRLLGPAVLRDGVLAIGVAPAEIASVAVTGIAGGDVAVAAGLLVASILVSVVAAGPILSLAGGGHGASAGHVLFTLTLVVGLPLLAGLAVRRLTAADRAEDAFQALAIVVVVVLVWLVSGQVRLSAAYLALVAVLVLLIIGSAAIGLLLCWRVTRPAATGIVLSLSMRDFAVASGIASAAFGPVTAAPLGIYGVLVMAWGALVARVTSSRPPAGRRDG